MYLMHTLLVDALTHIPTIHSFNLLIKITYKHVNKSQR